MSDDWGLTPSNLSSRITLLELLSQLKAPLSNVGIRRNACVEAVFRLDSGHFLMVN